MALTLTEGNKYSTTKLQAYVIDRLAKPSEILKRLPFETIVGNSLTYNTVTTRSGAQFYAVGDTWVESTPTLTQATADIVILGGDADVDAFLKKTRSNIIDLKRTVVDDKTKAVRETYLDAFYYGVSGTNNQFSGLQTLIASTTYNTVHAGSGTGTALSMLKLDQAIDLITGVNPSVIVTTKAMRTRIGVYLNSIGSAFPRGSDEWGKVVSTYREIPIITDDILLNTETAASGAYSAKTGGTCTTIFVLTFGTHEVCGLQNGSVEAVPLGDLETKDAERVRIKWYCGLMFEDLRSACKVDGVLSGSAVTA